MKKITGQQMETDGDIRKLLQ